MASDVGTYFPGATACNFSAALVVFGANRAVTNTGKGGPAKLSVAGRAIEGNLVPYAAAGSVVAIDCEV